MSSHKFAGTEPDSILNVVLKALRLSSTTKARKLIKYGSVLINGRVAARPDEMVAPGDVVQIVKKSVREKNPAPFAILYEDEYVLIAVKPAGILSVDRENEKNAKTFYKIVNEYVREMSRHKERVFLVHRLDREVSGIMIFAKSLHVQKLLEDDWKNNDKIYYAMVEGSPEQSEGRIESWLAENKSLKVYSTTMPGPNVKHAVTFYRVVQKTASLSLVEVRLETGRKNQIRVHLADLGCPIVGDFKYGAKTAFFDRVALHASRFSFNHPISSERITVESPLPLDMLKQFPALEKG